jgi:hypothetical protein
MGFYDGIMGFKRIYPLAKTYKKLMGKIHHAING